MSNLLQNKFSEKDFVEYVSSNLPDFQLTDSRVETRRGFSAIKQIGESSSLDLVIFAVTPESSIHARMEVSKQSYALLKSHPRAHALIAYSSDASDDWRLSLITTQVTRDKKGVKETVSNPRRFSYVLGPKAKVNTPTKYLVAKGNIIDLNDLKERFSLEVVNKDFYREISHLFTKLTGGTIGIGRNRKEYEALLRLPSIPEKDRRNSEFAVRLIGRVIFCWFLREKRSTVGISLMPKELLSFGAIEKQPDYYHSILEAIFFEVLNKQIKSRKDRYVNLLFSSIPYLNGGLFSPENDDYFSYNEDRQTIFHNTVVVPDEWIKEFFAFLETYNFTIDENVSFDEELSIDPEMLGRIFENLLAEINPETGESARKNTGSYYTPRAIVDYMVDESLLVYLKEKTGIDEIKLRALISYDLEDNLVYPLTDDEYGKVVDSLSTIKILDPACGSGAFPIGALQKIVFILQQVDPDGHKWFEKQLVNTGPEIRRVIEREFANKNFNYIRKLGVIRENIFGVDIQPIATEISRLRCFLTLVVDESIHDELENRGIEPLPNLDFKFVTANTLIQLPGAKEQTLFKDKERIDQLKDLRSQFFSSTNSERQRLQLEFKELQNQMLDRMIETKGEDEITRTLSTWNPFSHKVTPWFDPGWMFGIEGGFDILIANPPYIRQEHLANKESLKEHFPDVYDGRADIYTYFIRLGFRLLTNSGVLAYITSNKYLIRGYGKKIRRFLAADVTLKQLINFGELPVFQASVDSAIIIAKNTPPKLSESITFAQAKEDSDIFDLKQFFDTNNHQQSLETLKNESWVFERPEKMKVLQKIVLDKKTLSDLFEIFGGIKTGLDDAFVIDESTKDQLISSDPNSASLIKPWLKGRDIKRWMTNHHLYIIYIPQNRIDINDFPALKNHLEKYKEKLLQRATNQKWYELQQPQERFTSLFEGPKIVYSEIAKEMRAFNDNSHAYGTMKMFFIPYDPVVLAILNSKLFDWYARMTFSSLGDPWNGGRLEFKTMYMSKLPLPELVGSIQNEITALVEDLSRKNSGAGFDDQIDNLVYKLYGLNEDEIKVIESRK